MWKATYTHKGQVLRTNTLTSEDVDKLLESAIGREEVNNGADLAIHSNYADWDIVTIHDYFVYRWNRGRKG